MFKNLKSIESIPQLSKDIIEVDNDSKARHYGSKFDRSEIDGGEVDNEIKKKGQKMSKSKNLFKSKNCLNLKKR